MESKYYSAKDICQLTGYSKSKAYDLIRTINSEIKKIYKDKPIEEQPLVLEGRVLKSYFDRKVST